VLALVKARASSLPSLNPLRHLNHLSQAGESQKNGTTDNTDSTDKSRPYAERNVRPSWSWREVRRICKNDRLWRSSSVPSVLSVVKIKDQSTLIPRFAAASVVLRMEGDSQKR